MVRTIVFTLYDSFETYKEKDIENYKSSISSIEEYCERINKNYDNENIIRDQSDNEIIGYMTYYCGNFEDIMSSQTSKSYFTIKDCIHEKTCNAVLDHVQNAIQELQETGITIYVPKAGESWDESITIPSWVWGHNGSRLIYPLNELPEKTRKQILLWHLYNWQEELVKVKGSTNQIVYCYCVPDQYLDD